MKHNPSTVKEQQNDIQAAPKQSHMTIPQSRSTKTTCSVHTTEKKLDVHTMDPCTYNNNCILVHGCLILYEIADKLVDLFIANNYEDENITNDPKDSVHTALMVFFVIGLNVTIPRVGLYLWRIHLYRTGDDSKNEIHAAINLWMSLAKVWLEAFPQSAIAKFYFGNCALEDNIKALVQAFDVFSIFPFIMFVCYTYYYCRTLEEGSNRATTLVLLITLILSIVGIIFAGISINNFNDRC